MALSNGSYPAPQFPAIREPLVDVRDQPTEHSQGNAIYIGPTAVCHDLGPPPRADQPPGLGLT